MNFQVITWMYKYVRTYVQKYAQKYVKKYAKKYAQKYAKKYVHKVWAQICQHKYGPGGTKFCKRLRTMFNIQKYKK